MTHIHGAPEAFADEALAGFCDLHHAAVRRVPGGVARASATPEGKVAVVIGGGSGHYPAFAGYVGAGLADGAVCGDIFASPSAREAQDVMRATSRGGGVLMSFGNYAGDVLNFGLAAERLRSEGIDVRILPVTDDIASAPPEEAAKRRGVAGDVVVFKVAGAAAEEGMDLDGVERVARAANDATRSFGVAFGGCTLPGADAPLFTVPEGEMALGLGVHGEPGIEDRPLAGADELAQLLVDRVLADAPSGLDGSGRVAVILNGLGDTKYEELFVLWGRIAGLLRERGLQAVSPEVGELVTSLDMAGCSLTLTWLDDELARLWQAPAAAPAFTRGALDVGEPLPDDAYPDPDGSTGGAARTDWPQASGESVALGATVAEAIGRVAAALAEAEEELGALDAVAGDGDHGRGMARGSRAAAQAAGQASEAGAGAASVLAAAADAWADEAGGTSGALWGVGLRAASTELSDTSADADVAAAARAGLEAVTRFGKAEVGDKTLLDALVPFVDTLGEQAAAGAAPTQAWQQAAQAATSAAEATAQMRPRLGRARPLAERSLGHADPGAVSLALVARTVADTPAS